MDAPGWQAPRAGEMLTCPACGSKDYEIRFGGSDPVAAPPSVTCAACRKTWQLRASWPDGHTRLIPEWEPAAGDDQSITIGKL
jgi:transposase-like protein